MKNWFKKNKDLLVPTASAIAVIILLGGIGTFLNSGSDSKKDNVTEEPPKKIEIPVDQNQGSQADRPKSEEASQPQTFYIEPLPGQILEAIEGLDPVALDEKSREFPGLKVMWPLYFFKLEEDENKKTFLYLDVSEDGFGITVVCDVDVNIYPQLKEAKSGELLWVAGEISGLDTSGTGQFYIKTEQIRFGGTKEAPPPESLSSPGESSQMASENSGEVPAVVEEKPEQVEAGNN